jgi:hypothetical protein
MDAIRSSVEQLYNDKERNIIVLNEGLEFKESSNTSVEMQLSENKKSIGNEIKSLFGINVDSSGKFDYFEFLKNAVFPSLGASNVSDSKILRLRTKKLIFGHSICILIHKIT